APDDADRRARERRARLARVDAIDARPELELDVAQRGLERIGEQRRAGARRVRAIHDLVHAARAHGEPREQPAIRAGAHGDRGKARDAARAAAEQAADVLGVRLADARPAVTDVHDHARA